MAFEPSKRTRPNSRKATEKLLDPSVRKTTTSSAAPAARAAERLVAPKKPGHSATTKKAPPKGAAASKAPPAERKKKGGPQEATTSKFFASAMARARRNVGNKGELLDLVDSAEKKSKKFKSGAGVQLLAELKTMLRLVRAYAADDYRDISWESMVLIVAGIVYVVSPIDLIPDPIAGAGFLDDAVVVAFVLKVVRDELSDFTRWEQRRVIPVVA